MRFSKVFPIAATLLALSFPAFAEDPEPAKILFGSEIAPTAGKPQSIGFYSKGCLAGAEALPIDGPNWQAMRLSRNRRFGHPDTIALIERLSREAAQYDGWPGLLVGDISQPRGGPMLSGHASHQVGLDADIWLNPMPDRRYTLREREDISAVSVLKNDGTLFVDPKKFTPAHELLIMRAASYPEVQRIFVHPGIKKALCDDWKGERTNLAKVRPYYGHHYHFHIRLFCQPGSPGCKPQNAVDMKDDGCGANLSWWLSDEPWKPKKPVPSYDQKPKTPKPKPSRPSYTILSDLPSACAAVLDAPAPSPLPATAMTPAIPLPPLAPWPEIGPLPTPRPAG